MSTRAKCLVRCSTFPDRFYELLVRQEKGMVTIGAKRIVNYDGYSADAMEKYSVNTIKGEYKLINGVDFSCPHCKAKAVFLCRQCNSWSCQGGTHIPCCDEFRGEVSPIDYITASNTDEVRAQLAHDTSGMVNPVNNKTLYIGKDT